MIAYQKEKIENAIGYFAKAHQEATRKPLFQTFLYKYLAFLDFESLEKSGRPALGLEYKAMKKGPVPIKIYANRSSLKTDCFEFRKVGEDQYVILSRGTPDLSYFSPFEIRQMKRLIEIFADRFVTTNEISEASHEQIKAWKRTPLNKIMEYELNFDGDVKKKDPKKLTHSEESFLIYKGLEENAH